jgi:hypothetical protein
MDRFYLTIICGGILLLVTALALTAPQDLGNGHPDQAILLDGGQH